MKRLLVVAAFAALVGCVNPNTGSFTRVGDFTALPEVTTPTDSLTLKIFWTMTGAGVWTARDSKVEIVYENDYTNSYLGVIDTKGDQRLRVEIEPLEVSPSGSVPNTEDETASAGDESNASHASGK